MGMPVALGNGVKVDKGSASRKSDSHRIRSLIISVPVLMKKTADWIAVCGKTAHTVRREGRAKPVPTPIDFRSLLSRHSIDAGNPVTNISLIFLDRFVQDFPDNGLTRPSRKQRFPF
uniref:Uncharacterized protein n=1 Tax=Candidatus Kentrum sp. LPFa TaxID=2126335 RepID=A0A450WUB6_9GAMM|nr:MAG: hypothetical protein BECKLPF1236A_GA0070988_102682 [Candidatus Kentron sp. LPFa]